MAVSTNTMERAAPNRARMAYYGAGSFALLAIAVTLAFPLRLPLGESADTFAMLAHLSFWSALGYLFVTACTHFWNGRHLDRVPANFGTTVIASAAHILVLLVSAVSIFRGLRSRALLADLDEVIAAVAVVSLLSLVLEAAYYVMATRDEMNPAGSSPAWLRHWPRLLQAAMGLAAGISLACLESLPLPNSRAASDIANTPVARAENTP